MLFPKFPHNFSNKITYWVRKTTLKCISLRFLLKAKYTPVGRIFCKGGFLGGSIYGCQDSHVKRKKERNIEQFPIKKNIKTKTDYSLKYKVMNLSFFTIYCLFFCGKNLTFFYQLYSKNTREHQIIKKGAERRGGAATG